MNFLKLQRPIVFFDLETTGVDIQEDRIVQFAAIRINLDGTRSHLKTYVNPGRSIPAEATEIHGITDEMVANEPPFSEIADPVCSFFAGCDIGGYNVVKFDIPILLNELLRCRKSISLDVAIVDACQIFYKREPRDLESAVKFYTDGEHVDAHDAMADVEATIAVLEGQLRRYDDLPRTPREIFDEVRDPDAIDLAGKLRWENGKVVLTFGKNKGRPLDTIDRSYFSWMLSKQVVGPDAEHIIRDALRGKFYNK